MTKSYIHGSPNLMTRRAALALPLLSACRKQQSATMFVDPALATLVPTDASFVLGVRMQQLYDTRTYREHLASGSVTLFDEFHRATGLDARKDLWEFLTSTDPRGTVALIRGKFSEMGMEPRLERDGAKRFGYGGLTFIGDEDHAVAFLNPTTALAGSLPALKYVVDHRTASTGLPPRIQARVSKIPSTNQIWFAGDPMAFGFAGLPPAALLQTVNAISGGIDLRTGFELHAVAEADSATDANRLRDAVRGVLGMGRLTTPSDRTELLRLYESVRTESDGPNLRVDMKVAPELVDELVRLGSMLKLPRS